MGRQAAGVIGIRIKDKDFVVGMEIIDGDVGELFLLRPMVMASKLILQISVLLTVVVWGSYYPYR